MSYHFISSHASSSLIETCPFLGDFVPFWGTLCSNFGTCFLFRKLHLWPQRTDSQSYWTVGTEHTAENLSRVYQLHISHVAVWHFCLRSMTDKNKCMIPFHFNIIYFLRHIYSNRDSCPNWNSCIYHLHRWLAFKSCSLCKSIINCFMHIYQYHSSHPSFIQV